MYTLLLSITGGINWEEAAAALETLHLVYLQLFAPRTLADGRRIRGGWGGWGGWWLTRARRFGSNGSGGRAPKKRNKLRKTLAPRKRAARKWGLLDTWRV